MGGGTSILRGSVISCCGLVGEHGVVGFSVGFCGGGEMGDGNVRGRVGRGGGRGACGIDGSGAVVGDRCSVVIGWVALKWCGGALSWCMRKIGSAFGGGFSP